MWMVKKVVIVRNGYLGKNESEVNQKRNDSVLWPFWVWGGY
jgi:hypothetical protein